MPLVSVSCLLCGSEIDESEHLPDWMGRFRALYTVLQEWDSAQISRASERRPDSDLVPLDQAITQAVRHLDLTEPTIDGDFIKIHLSPKRFGEPYPPPLPLTPLPLWGFALHASCWSLLGVNYPRLRSEPTACIQALFHLCRSQPINLGTMDWGHDYGGLFCRTPESHELLPGEDTQLQTPQSSDRLFHCDPFHIPQLTAQAHTSGALPGIEPVRQHCSRDQGSANRDVDPFHRFPLEIATDILVLLQSADVASLRLASRSFANRPLLDCFWRSRFCAGQEFAHLFEYASSKHTPARELFETARSIRHLPAVNNRRRVWSLASFLASLIESRLGASRCDGTPCQSFFEPDANPEKGKWLVAQGTVSDAKTHLTFTEGSRPLFNRLLSPGALAAAGCVSFICIGDRRYVTGFRLTQHGGGMLQFGYRQPEQETKIIWPGDIPQSISLSGIEVALDPRGIRALRYLTSCGRCSNWVGEHEGLPKARLVSIDADHPLQTLKGGFDALKLVSLSISVDTFRGNPISPDGRREMSKAWYPQVPADSLKFSGVEIGRLSYSQVFSPFSTCLFGGKSGELLPHLTQVTVWTVTSPQHALWENRFPWAIVFHYDRPIDGCETRTLGLVPRTEHNLTQAHNFQISSGEGERITRIDVHYLTDKCPAAFTFYTNRVRRTRIPRGSLEDIPEDEFSTEQLVPKGKEVIIGLFSSLKQRTVLENLGILCIERPDDK
ncbi:uncharacterized protein JN550_003673 [Neoarthrinium moseri]|uniref:uncharacterized protein n=1 Tax=Neoarthrinium moseri TaxID=1658444 RepID=UPI001FDDC3DD|nr:uncharacterized protein JN550_003673 [Neoarthrinium moseri]KAI1872799.1 hypothetical protein JN550_003673 [Neoarthrinium moseri]